MKISETSVKKKGHYKTQVYFVICECENCYKRFNLRKSSYLHYVRKGRTVGKFCSRKCRKLYHDKQVCSVEDCNKKPTSNKFCQNHNRANKLYGNPLKTAGTYKCIVCKKTKRRKNNSSSKYSNIVCGLCLSTYLRELVLKTLGSRCECCNEKVKDFLQLDHILEGGASERRLIKNKNAIYERALKSPKDYRLLCANCNWGIYINSGVCPHQIKN